MLLKSIHEFLLWVRDLFFFVFRRVWNLIFLAFLLTFFSINIWNCCRYLNCSAISGKKNKNLNFEHHLLVKLSHKSGIQTAVFIYLLFPLHFYNIPQHPQSDFALIIAPLYSHCFGLMNKTRLAYPIWILIENSPARCNHRRLYCTCVNIHCVCDNIGPLLAIMTLACKRAEDKLDWLVA